LYKNAQMINAISLNVIITERCPSSAHSYQHAALHLRAHSSYSTRRALSIFAQHACTLTHISTNTQHFTCTRISTRSTSPAHATHINTQSFTCTHSYQHAVLPSLAHSYQHESLHLYTYCILINSYQHVCSPSPALSYQHADLHLHAHRSTRSTLLALSYQHAALFTCLYVHSYLSIRRTSPARSFIALPSPACTLIHTQHAQAITLS
jgi:hypothetical protein